MCARDSHALGSIIPMIDIIKFTRDKLFNVRSPGVRFYSAILYLNLLMILRDTLKAISIIIKLFLQFPCMLLQQQQALVQPFEIFDHSPPCLYGKDGFFALVHFATFTQC